MYFSSETFTEDMEKCNHCTKTDCPCKKLVQFLQEAESPEIAFSLLENRRVDPKLREAFEHYLDIINPEIYD